MSMLNLIYPMFAMVLLSVTVLGILFGRRVRSVRSGRVEMRYYRTYQGAPEPEEALQAARHFANLFEAPVLFYAGCLAAMIAGIGDTLTLTLAWIYVAARTLHAYVHLGRNRVRHRMLVYFTGWLALIALWIDIVVRVASRAH